MNIRYPVRKADGRDYKNYDALLTDIRKNAHGWWLLGVNHYWHGGIHVGMSSSPASMLDQETPEKSVPLQFMIDGEVVAWRVNRDYANIECYQERPLRQSGTFVLVKSVYKSDEQDESSWLTLYQLYMHIAPLSEFPKRPLYRVTQKGHGVRMRKHSRHDDSREIAPDVLANKHGHARTLVQADTLAVLQQKSFLLEQRPEPFALVQRLQDGKPAGELFWVSMRPEYLEPDGQCYVCLPDWMHSALNHGVFDDVVVPPVPLKVVVKAGDAVGFLGAQDLADEDNYPQIITTDYKAHIELMSLDEHVPDVVANVKGIKTGKQFIKLKLKRPLYLRNVSQRSVWHFHPLEFLEMLRKAEFPRTPVNGELIPLEFINFYNGDRIDETDYEEAAKKLNCEVAAIKAVAKTETGVYGSYFKFQQDDDYVPAILFERHHFHKYTNGKYDKLSDISSPDSGGYGPTSEQYSKLLRAYALDKKSALKSASWGKFQILASNHVAAGYASPEDFVFALSKSEKNQLKAFVSFIEADSVLLKSLRSKDWLSFAKRYNGKRQKGYDLKMEENYNASL